jgi:hypothetical protein
VIYSYAGCDGENIVALSEDDPKLEDVSKDYTTPVVAPVEAGVRVMGLEGTWKMGFG